MCSFKLPKILFIFLCLGLIIIPGSASELNVVYPNMVERSGESYGYKVLELALEKSGFPYTLKISEKEMNQERAKESINIDEISVMDFGTSPEFEQQYDPVYFPIDRGIGGYRIFIINKELDAKFAEIKNLDDLKIYEAGQGLGWADVKVLENAGIKVLEIAKFDSLFKMVNAKRFDFFPLGVEEIFGLFDYYKNSIPDSMIDTHLVFHYTIGRLFFVKKGNTQLRNVLQNGLEAAFADGSFQKLVGAHFEHEISKADIGNRLLIEIDNPNLTSQFRKIPSEYFYNSQQEIIDSIK